MTPQHRHLLLVGGTGVTQRERLRHCSVSRHVDGVSRLHTHLDISEPHVLVLVQVSRDWLADPALLHLMVRRLGNVSVFIGGHHAAATVLHHCHRLTDHCYRLDTLLPVLDEMHKWTPTDDVSSTLLDIYDPRWLPVTLPPPLTDTRNRSLTVHTQIEQLASKFCVRDRRLNRYFELHHSTDPDDM